jgi:8-oxo-dGTP pyrophosphatase MutT (NUDIX family)
VAVPEHVLRLREKVGTDLLFLPAVCGIVVDAAGRVLLNRRTDTGRWALLGGILDPGEDVAAGVVREVLEETGVHVRPDRIVGVWTVPPMECPNGDRVSYVVTTFRCTPLSGEARVNDDESLEVAWFAPDALPPLSASNLERLAAAVSERAAAVFPASSDRG